jgi:hypothetical protein
MDECEISRGYVRQQAIHRAQQRHTAETDGRCKIKSGKAEFNARISSVPGLLRTQAGEDVPVHWIMKRESRPKFLKLRPLDVDNPFSLAGDVFEKLLPITVLAPFRNVQATALYRRIVVSERDVLVSDFRALAHVVSVSRPLVHRRIRRSSSA